MKTLPTCLLIITSVFSMTVNATEYEIDQKNKQFSERKLEVKIGDTVKFVNADPFFHNVYSLSDTKPFDLGFYRKGLSKSVTFDKAGTVEVECAIHPNMKLTIDVNK